MGSKYLYTIENFSRINNGVSPLHNIHKGLLECVDPVAATGRLINPNVHYGRTIQTRYMRARYYVVFTNVVRYIDSLFQGTYSAHVYVTYHVYSAGNGLLIYRRNNDTGLRVQMCRQ